MAQSNITISGTIYPDVPALSITKSGGGSSLFTDVSDTTATAEDVIAGKYFYTAAGVKTEGTGSGGGGGADIVFSCNGTVTAANITVESGSAQNVLAKINNGEDVNAVLYFPYTTGSYPYIVKFVFEQATAYVSESYINFHFMWEEKGTNELIQVNVNLDNTIRSASLTRTSKIQTTTVSLLASGWSNKEQTVTATGVTTTNTVIVAADPFGLQAYSDADIYCYGQMGGYLGFRCSEVPSVDIVVNVLIIN